jgi:hypothetical protein
MVVYEIYTQKLVSFYALPTNNVNEMEIRMATQEWHMPVIPATWQMEKKGSQFEATIGKDPISTNKPGMVAHIYNLSGQR